MERGKEFFASLLMILLAFLAVSTVAIWEDGGRFAFVKKQHRSEPDGVAGASYLDAGRFEWKTDKMLHQYAREHRLELLSKMEREGSP
jgi:hypothetical protein